MAITHNFEANAVEPRLKRLKLRATGPAHVACITQALKKQIFIAKFKNSIAYIYKTLHILST